MKSHYTPIKLTIESLLNLIRITIESPWNSIKPQFHYINIL